MNVHAKLTILFVFVIVLVGCSTKEFEINNKLLANIKPGKTTKMEMFDLLDIPKAIAVMDRPMYLVLPNYRRETMPPRDSLIQVQAEPFYEIFKTRNVLKDVHRVYYYHVNHYESSFMSTEIRFQLDRLWVLVNEETGLVEDLVFRPHTE